MTTHIQSFFALNAGAIYSHWDEQRPILVILLASTKTDLSYNEILH
jgi:hypothetical protein